MELSGALELNLGRGWESCAVHGAKKTEVLKNPSQVAGHLRFSRSFFRPPQNIGNQTWTIWRILQLLRFSSGMSWICRVIYSGFRVDGTDPKMSFIDGGPYKPPLGVCAIYSQSTIYYMPCVPNPRTLPCRFRSRTGSHV